MIEGVPSDPWFWLMVGMSVGCIAGYMRGYVDGLEHGREDREVFGG